MLLVALLPVGCIPITCIALGFSNKPATLYSFSHSYSSVYSFIQQLLYGIQCHIHSFIQYVLSTYYVPDTLLGTRDITANKTDTLPVSTEFAIQFNLVP